MGKSDFSKQHVAKIVAELHDQHLHICIIIPNQIFCVLVVFSKIISYSIKE